MQFKLRTLLIILGIAPPLLAGLLYAITSTWHYWPLILLFIIAFAPIWIPFFLIFVLIEGGNLLRWLFTKQVAADKAQVEQMRQSRQKKTSTSTPSDI